MINYLQFARFSVQISFEQLHSSATLCRFLLTTNILSTQFELWLSFTDVFSCSSAFKCNFSLPSVSSILETSI